MRHLTIWLISLLIPFAGGAQSLSLMQAYEKARNNYPLIRQKDLISRTASLNINNLSKNFLPQLSFSGQATYQSDVTRVDVPIPGITIDAPEKDQYKITADINQLLYDGGLTKQQKKLQELNAALADQQVDVELHKLRERINQLFLGILLLDEQIKQVDIVQADIAIGIRRVQAQVQNGVAFKSNLSILKAESIKNGQRLIELTSGRKSLVSVLELFVGEKLAENTRFEQTPVTVKNPDSISRPELTVFQSQRDLYEQQNRIIKARNLPKTSLFVQGGYGRPGLNLLKNEFDLFYIGGLRFNWSLGGLYTSRNDRRIIKLNQDLVDTQKAAFVLNTNADLIRQQQEIDKLKALIASDKEIITLRTTITDAARAQLENGVITASDYLGEINAADQSRQALILHEVQLLQAQINYQTISGN